MTDTNDHATATDRPIVPAKLAHFVIRTNHFLDMLAWYRTVFHAKTSFENPVIAFLTYDDEHHRIAFLNTAGLPAADRLYTGVDHVAFTYRDLADLLLTYERLKGHGVLPFWCINHGPTTSMYYRDPDGNELEFQAENFDNVDDATSYFFSEAFSTNPIGVDFDPDLLLAKLRSGVPVAQLLRQGAAPVAPGKAYVYTKLPPPPGA
jgi:catechol 2,3-dioxygenase-like lactoylglutathione lyase family enzyme